MDVAPLDVAVAEASLSPRPNCCSKAVSSPLSGRSTYCSSSESSDTSDSDVDDEGAGEVQRYLEEMNAASESVNILQRALQEYSEERSSCEEAWAELMTRLSRTLGKERLARFQRWRGEQSACQSAQLAVQQASTRYSAAVDAQQDTSEVARLEREHAHCLSAYMAAQTRLAEIAKNCTEPWGAVVPFFEAEQEHCEHLAAIDASVAEVRLQLDASRRRYSEALRGLEALSDKMHSDRKASVCQ